MAQVELSGSAEKPRGADEAVRRLLLISSSPGSKVSEQEAQRVFSVSMTISALRCLLSYVALPILTPLVGVAASVGPWVGIPIAVAALYFDVKGIRRLWATQYRWRWHLTVVYLAVMGLVTYLLVGDILKLFT